MAEESRDSSSGNVQSVKPFGVNFEIDAFTSGQTSNNTNTYSMSDDDTGTYRNDTEDNDT